MPLYTYRCTNNHETDEFLSMSDRKDKILCPICNNVSIRVFSIDNMGLKFKGNGFYETDYKKQTHKEIK